MPTGWLPDGLMVASGWLGGSPQMIFEHYRELVTEKAAKAWFAITPDAARALKAKIEKERTAKILAFPRRLRHDGGAYG